MDGRKNNKGTKGNKGGRPSKAEEFKLIERLDSKKSPDWVLNILFDHIEDGNFKAVELYMGYRYGKPKQIVEHEGEGLNTINIPLVNWVSNKDKGIDFMDNFEDEQP